MATRDEPDFPEVFTKCHDDFSGCVHVGLDEVIHVQDTGRAFWSFPSSPNYVVTMSDWHRRQVDIVSCQRGSFRLLLGWGTTGESKVTLDSQFLTLMLLVTNLANTKWCKKPEKWPKPWQMGTHMKVLGESFPINANMAGFRWFSKIFASLCFVWK